MTEIKQFFKKHTSKWIYWSGTLKMYLTWDLKKKTCVYNLVLYIATQKHIFVRFCSNRLMLLDISVSYILKVSTGSRVFLCCSLTAVMLGLSQL